MQLLIHGVPLRIVQMGPDFLLIDADAAHAPGEATVLMRIAASERRWGVSLPQGIVASGKQEIISMFLPGQSSRREISEKAVITR